MNDREIVSTRVSNAPRERVFNAWTDDVVEPERIVLDHVTEPRFQLTATFAREGDNTRLTWRIRFATTGEYDNAKPFVAKANEENFDRLAAHLKGA